MSKGIKEYFFVKRPVFATVISILITLIGLVAMKGLPVEQFPNLTPPQVMVRASYNGAAADTIAKNVASILETQINGVDNMIYMNSVSGSGSMSLTITFAIGTDPDMATINVNNRVQLALSQLPQEVQQLGVSVIKRNPSMLLMVMLYSPDQRYDAIYLNNYSLLNVLDSLKLVPGVGDANNFSPQKYAMRLWLDPMKMAKYNITPADVSSAVRSQNAQFSAGRLGDAPVAKDVEVTMQVLAAGRLNTPEEFEKIVIQRDADGTTLHLGDVARVELGAENYNFSGRLDGKDALPIGIFTAPGANAIATADAVKAKMEELSQNFPDGVDYAITYDTTQFISISIQEVIKTLIEAMILVFLVVYLFLQNWRATLIPCLAVPVAIIGTFAGMYALGFTINTLTMFGLVLAIGMVVDDAIVVLENVERHLADGLSPKDAASKAMSEVTKPVIAIVLVLCSVFIPVAFTGGMAGKMYQQFAITIAISVVISGIVALTFTPALCGMLLKRHKEGQQPIAPFRWFNNFFDTSTNWYVYIVKFLLKRGFVSIGLFVATCVLAMFFLSKLPTGLVPNEDQGVVMGIVTLPDGAAISRTIDAAATMEQALMRDSTVDHVSTMAGIDMLSGALKSNSATLFINMKHWDERPNDNQSSFALVKKFFGMGMNVPQAFVIAFNPPAVSGMGTTGGFEGYIQNTSGDSNEQMNTNIQAFVRAATARPEIQSVNNGFSLRSPELYLTVDRQKLATMGVSVADVFSVLVATFGSSYINDFDMYGRTFRVYMQADGQFRSAEDNLGDIYVKNINGSMTPVDSLVTKKLVAGPQIVERFNNFIAGRITGTPAIGYSSGQAMNALRESAKETLPVGYNLAWSGISYQENQVSSSTMLIFVLALVVVFLILAAQYESWSIPITVVSAVPFAVLGAAVGTYLRGYENDIYFQVALVTLVGLAAKNAILIVEFAVENYRKEGHSIMDAAEIAAKLRFRPIIMTSLAFIFGCVPLAISFGAGAASRHSIGTAVIGGMIAATVLAPMFVPYFFKLVASISERFFGKKGV